MYKSGFNKITGNNCQGRGLWIGGESINDFIQNINNSNTVNGKPMYYFLNKTRINIDGWLVGQLFIVNCTNVIVSGINISNTVNGIEIAYSSDVQIIDSDFSDNLNSIYLSTTQNISIVGNKFYSDSIWFVRLDMSKSSIIKYNELISNCSLSIGIFVTLSDNNTLYGNVIKNCKNGVDIISSNNNVILNNNISNNFYGISISAKSNYNKISDNIFFSNNNYGIIIDLFSEYNRIYYNNFNYNNGAISTSNFNNIQANDTNGNNFWNTSGTPHGYGNYWSDWTSPDVKKGPNQDQPGSDGIVDSPYLIDGGAGVKDFYPLTSPVIVNEFSPNILIIAIVLLSAGFIMVRNKFRISTR